MHLNIQCNAADMITCMQTIFCQDKKSSGRRVNTMPFLVGGGGGRVQWLSGRVLDSRPRGRGLESHRRHCVLVLEQDTFILA